MTGGPGDEIASALLTDLYELNMAASYLRRAMTGTATFSLFVRRLPPQRGFLVAAGLEACLEQLEHFHFEPDELAYLGQLGFDDRTVKAFAGLHFTGDVHAVPEGRIVFANEPLLEVSAPIAEAQLVETVLLNLVTFHTAVASKAARCQLAARGRIQLVEFGLRRTQGVEAGLAAARAAGLVGFAGTSNVEAARRYGMTPAGTMAHSYIEAFPNELEAFRAFAQDSPGRATFLVDTYDTLEGVDHAIEVIEALGLTADAGVRIDSGDLGALARRARQRLDKAGLGHVRIFVSGDLDEVRLAELVASGAPVDAAGVGTRLGVSADAPYLDTVYKLVAFDGRPVLKLSAGKSTFPGAKQVFRGPGLSDVLALRHEPGPEGTEPLLEPAMVAGRRLSAPDDPVSILAAARERFEADCALLPPATRRIADPRPLEPALSPDLARLTAQVAAGLRHPGMAER